MRQPNIPLAKAVRMLHALGFRSRLIAKLTGYGRTQVRMTMARNGLNDGTVQSPIDVIVRLFPPEVVECIEKARAAKHKRPAEGHFSNPLNGVKPASKE